ncbi:hypothetical protein O76HUS_23990 [Escherichia coli]|nr:hypothetical protein O76HUS_23990 [Escherichia coli]
MKHKAKRKPINPERALSISKKNNVITMTDILENFDRLLNDNTHIAIKAKLSLTIW